MSEYGSTNGVDRPDTITQSEKEKWRQFLMNNIDLDAWMLDAMHQLADQIYFAVPSKGVRSHGQVRRHPG